MYRHQKNYFHAVTSSYGIMYKSVGYKISEQFGLQLKDMYCYYANFDLVFKKCAAMWAAALQVYSI